jgi:hypothetical protein
MHRLDRIDHQQRRRRSPASVVRMSRTEVAAASCSGASASPSRAGAQPHLPGRLLAADVDSARARSRHLRRSLQQQRRLADPRLAAHQHRRSGHEPAAERAVELGEAGAATG